VRVVRIIFGLFDDQCRKTNQTNLL